MSPILVTPTSRSDSNFERSNISPKENKRNGVDLNSNGLDCCVGKNEGKILWFSADCIELIHNRACLSAYLIPSQVQDRSYTV